MTKIFLDKTVGGFNFFSIQSLKLPLNYAKNIRH